MALPENKVEPRKHGLVKDQRRVTNTVTANCPEHINMLDESQRPMGN